MGVGRLSSLSKGLNIMEPIEVGEIGNYYGGLSIKEEDGHFFWSIENYDGDDWEEIPRYLYIAIRKYEQERPPKDKLGGYFENN